VFFSDYVMEILSGLGSELIGAAVTAYLLGILMNKQQDNAARWRAEIRRRLKARKTGGKVTSG
jgi:hypothetical protein